MYFLITGTQTSYKNYIRRNRNYGSILSKQFGTFEAFYPNGKTKEKGYLDMGKKNGQWIEYYSNGNVKEEGK